MHWKVKSFWGSRPLSRLELWPSFLNNTYPPPFTFISLFAFCQFYSLAHTNCYRRRTTISEAESGVSRLKMESSVKPSSLTFTWKLLSPLELGAQWIHGRGECPLWKFVNDNQIAGILFYKISFLLNWQLNWQWAQMKEGTVMASSICRADISCRTMFWRNVKSSQKM